MARHIVILQGHPDSSPARFCRAFAQAYEAGAKEGGHVVQTIEITSLNFPWLRTKADYDKGETPSDILIAQQAIAAANHIVLIYPLWLGDMPALLKAFLEQTFRPGFAYADSLEKGLPTQRLKGKSARIVVTMGMPAFFYRFYFRAHSLKNLKRNILAFCGIKPIRETLIGMVEGNKPGVHDRWLKVASDLGRKGL